MTTIKVNRLAEGVFTVENLLSPIACQAWIERSESIGYEPATVNGRMSSAVRREVRNNGRVILDDEEVAGELWQLVSSVVPKSYFYWQAVGVNERLRFYRYDPGQRFVWHMDGSFRRDNGEQSQMTYIIYLNEDFEGGATSFKGFRVTPKTGLGLVFLHKTLHQGDPVSHGRKYVLRSDIMFRDTRQSGTLV